MKLKFASVYPSTGLQGHRDTFFMDYVTDKTGGAITWETFWGGSLSDPRGHADQVIKGIADVVDTSPLYTPGFFPDAPFAFAFPFNPTSPHISGGAFRQMSDEFPQIAESYAKLHVKTLSNNVWSYYGMLSPHEIKTVDDLNGLTVGVIGKYYGRWMEVIGLVPKVSAAAERYMGVQTGVFDIDLLPIGLQVDLKIYEVSKYRLEVEVGTFTNEAIWINTDVFDKLTPKTQEIFVTAGLLAEEFHMDEAVENHDQSRKIMEDAGIIFNTLSDADKVKWANLLPDTPAELAAEMVEGGLPGWEMVERYLEIATELGHTWPRQWGVRP